MRVTTETILTALAPFAPELIGPETEFIEYGSIGSTLLLTTPDRLYIVSMSQLISHKNKVPAAAIICYRDKDAPAELSATQRTKYKKTPLILLDKETSFGSVWESLQDDLTTPYDPLLFQNKLLSLALSCHDVTDLLTAATECTGLPFSLHNTVPSLFAYSRAGEMVVTNPMGADVMETFCTPEFLTNLPDNALLDSVRERNGLMRVTLPNGVQKISATIYVRQQFFGMLCAYSFMRPYVPSDLDMIQQLRGIVSLFMENHSNDYVAISSNERSFMRIMLGNEFSEEDAQAQCKRFDITLPEEMTLLVVTSSAVYRHNQDVPCNLIRRFMIPLLQTNLCIIFEQYVVLLLDAKQYQPHSAEFLNLIQESIQEHNLQAASSNVFYSPKDIKTQYELAKLTIDIGESKDANKHYYVFSDYLLDHMIHLCKPSPVFKCLQHPVFIALERYDAQYHTEYVKTLMSYLRNNGDLSACAAEMDIHHNTVKYLMKNMREITNVDFDSPSMFSSLYVAMRAIEASKTLDY